MGGGTLNIPDWKSKFCTVGDHTPELQEIQRRLKVHGLKDPWLRNEAWRFARIERGYDPKFMAWSFIRPRAFIAGFVLAIVTAQVQIQYFDKKWQAEKGHLYDHH